MSRFSRSLRRSTLPLCVALSVAALVAPITAMAANNWNPSRILAAFENPYVGNTKDVGVISHRGIVDNGCPENSSCSILNTYNHNVEAIELDVKEDADGALWLFHDQNAGRMLFHLPNFDIFQPAQNPKGWDPDIRTLSSQELLGSFLRDRNFSKTGYHPVTVARALATVKTEANHMLVVLDIKTVTAVNQAANLAKQLGMQNQVVLKFSSSLFASNPNAMLGATKGVAFAPTVYAGDEDNIATHYNGLCGAISPESAQCRVNAWVNEAKGIGASWVEIGNKQPVSGDPTFGLLRAEAGLKRPVGAFSPVIEYRVNMHDGYHFVRSNGTCCAALNDYLSRTRYFGNETRDDRPNFTAQVFAGATNVITDDPLSVIPAVHRDTSRYQ
ncbi:glycerophosphodiester phosphodiesterase family protein [Luteibacter sp. ME-Dv--P-043b]|uniref:glycerophosphodiester phosphodiesterase family protein n=1 Tax=unclassified Luteibacter TaxID=2620188 RepID=UPI002552BDB4|nr:glycerophosphodiester phosphodiesterase family protein [Luteibacter sp. ME-Dv--P-043b]